VDKRWNGTFLSLYDDDPSQVRNWLPSNTTVSNVCVGLIENIDRYCVRNINEIYGRLGCDGMQFGRKCYFLGIGCIQIHVIGFTSLCYLNIEQFLLLNFHYT